MLQHTDIDALLIRRWFTDRSSIGEFFFSDSDIGKRECYILEDAARAPDIKLPKITCIPAGDFWIKITFSNRFQRLLPLIYNEEYYKDPITKQEYYQLIRFDKIIFTGVRMHIGNSDANTEACQLPGLSKAEDNYHVWQSTKAFDPEDGSEGLYQKIFNKIGISDKLRYRIIHKQS